LTKSLYSFLPPGSAQPGGSFYVSSQNYCTLLKVTPKNGWDSDIHEFLITPQGTAIFTVERTVQTDLTSFGGAADGYLQDNGIQEIDLKTGKVVFEWSFLDHVPLTESEETTPATADQSWDAYHINSIDFDDAGHLLVSARNTWTVYQISRSTGAIDWKLGGKASTFQVATDATFFWQHDARFLSGNQVSLYDDGCCRPAADPSPEQPSHGLVVQLDLDHLTATTVRQYPHDPTVYADSQGNVQTLSNGNRFIGWGNSQYYSELAPDATMLYDVLMPDPNISYRTFRFPWTGTPSSPPSVAARSAGQGSVVYASWNGSTGVSQWRVLAGANPGLLRPAGAAVTRSGFETAIPVISQGPYFQVEALDAAGNTLGTSPTVVLDGAASSVTTSACGTPREIGP
jgi:hypothetical protein